MSGDQEQADFVRLREIVDRHVMSLISWYQRKKRWPRRLHRLSSALIIGGSAFVPIATAWSAGTAARLMVATAGVLVTAVAGFATAYDWHRRWRLFAIAQNALEARIAEWEFALAAAELLPSVEQQRDEAVSATRDLLAAAGRIRRVETNEFFSGPASPPPVETDIQPGSAVG